MSVKKNSTRGFRPKGKTRERLEYAEKLGLNISELVNNILEDHLRDYLSKEIKDRQAALREALNAPVP